ncbi:MAG: permease [Anaerolineae bacterium]|nr:permease [Anaerolineae bacterium]
MTSEKGGGKSVDTTTLVLAVAAAVLLALAFRRGPSVALNGLLAAWGTLRRNLVLLILGFVLAGLVQVLIPRALINRWLGDQAGVKGILIGCVVGGLVPGAPYATFPLVASLYQAGASIGAVVGFVSAWALWSVSRLPVEIALIDPRPALIRYAITFVVPPIAGVLAEVVDRFV